MKLASPRRTFHDIENKQANSVDYQPIIRVASEETLEKGKERSNDVYQAESTITIEFFHANEIPPSSTASIKTELVASREERMRFAVGSSESVANRLIERVV